MIRSTRGAIAERSGIGAGIGAAISAKPLDSTGDIGQGCTFCSSVGIELRLIGNNQSLSGANNCPVRQHCKTELTPGRRRRTAGISVGSRKVETLDQLYRGRSGAIRLKDPRTYSRYGGVVVTHAGGATIW